MSKKPRPLPPYGRQVQERLKGDLRRYNGTSADGGVAQFIIAVGPEAMGWPARHPDTLAVAIPPDEDPRAFRWDWAARHAPALIICAGSASYADQVNAAYALLRDGADRVIVEFEDGWVRYEPERRAA